MAKKYVNASKNAGLKTNRITKRPVTTFVNASKRDEDKNQGGILGGTGYLLGNLGLGLAGVGEGVSDILSAGGDLLRGDTEMAKYRFKDNQTAEAREKLEKSYNPGTVMKLAGDVSSGIGNSLTFMIPYVGPYLAGAGYVGMGISDAAAKTGDVGAKELAYGAASGALEFGLDAITGGAGKAAKNLGASITRKLGREAAQAGAKATGKLAGKSFGKSVLVESLKGAGGEALEESLSELIDPQLQKLFGIDKNAETSLKNVAYAGLIGAISGGLMTAGPAAINYKNAASVGKQIRESGETEDFIQYTNDVLKAAQRTQTKYATAAEAAKTSADASVVQKFNAALNPLSTKNKSNRAKKRVEAIADTVQKNLNTLQQYRQNPTKTPKELEIADAVLGELRGNVFLMENASLLEYYEDSILDLSDEDKQSFVDEVNRRAKTGGAKKSDYTVEDLNNNTDDILTSVAAWRIDEDQYGDLFAKARKATRTAETTAQPAQEAAQATEGVKAEEEPAQPTNAVKKRFVGNGEVRIAGGKQVKDLNLSDEQYTAYKAAEILAPTTGADIELHESLDKDGKTANGYYDPATNTIHININAKRGTSGKQIALYTLGHETTHYIREWSPEKYDELARFVMDKLGGDTDSLVSSKADFLRTISDYQNKTDAEIMELAREEVVADGMELILTDGKVLEELAHKDRSLWQTVKSWIQNTIAKIKEYYGQLNQASKTAQTLRETLNTLEEVERLFTEAVKDAGEQTRTAREGTADRKYSIDEKAYKEKKSLEDYDYDLTDPWSIEPINNVTDRKKFNYLVKEFEETGYNGRPIVIVGNVALTGSHRILAAREAGIDIPTIDAEVDENNPLFFDLIDAKDDEERLEISKQLFEDGNMSEEAYKLIEREDDLNYENWKKKPEDQIRYSIDEISEDSATDTNVGRKDAESPDVEESPFDEAVRRMNEREKTVQEHVMLANALMGAAQSEQEYRAVKNYKEKAEDLAEAETRLVDLRKKTAKLNKEIALLKEMKTDIDRYRPEPEVMETDDWIEGELNEAQARKQAYMDEMDEIQKMLDREKNTLLSLSVARPLQSALKEAQKKAVAMERSAERAREREKKTKEWARGTVRAANEKADERVRETKEWARDTVRDIRAEANEKVRQAREDATDYKSAVYAKAYEKADERVRKHEQKREEKAKQSAERKEITIRKRATMRILGQINTMLYHPTKTKHVPAELQELAQTILRSVNPKDFEKNRNNLREMGELADKIEQDERKVAKTAKEQETMEKRKSKYEHLEAETLSTKRQAEVLLKAFEDYQKQASEGATFDQALIDSMSDAVDKIEEVPMTEMGLKSLEAVERFCTLLKHQIDNANKTFATEKSLDIDDLGRKAATETQETKPLKVLSPKGMEIAAFERVRKYFWKNMKPLTVFEAIGSKTFADLFQNVLNGEDVWARDIDEAKEKIQDVREKYKYKNWDLDERRAVKTKDGTVNLSLSEIMSLYAYSFRKQAVSHLEGGGFILDANATTKAKGEKLSMVALERRLNDSKRYVLDELLMGELAGMLTTEQQEYVREMQKYLTSLGEKGNTVSRKLYGIDIFTESDYFPIKVKSEYLKSQTGKSGDPNIKNRGMTKEVVPEAKDPLVLQGFDEIMVDHINSMATYHAFVLPIEDLTRVLNYKPMNVKRDKDGNPILDENGMPVADDKSGADYSTLKAVIESNYGATANEYIVQLIRDLNGGARRDAAAGIIDQGITAFKRASTMASLSVLVQQPTSLFRAMAYMDAKYLFGNASIVDFSHHKELWKRVKKYAPVAIIKEMGGYDTGVGARTGDYLNAATYEKGERVKGFLTDSNYRSEVFGIGAAYADEMAWIQLFEACVSEQADKLRADRNSEKVLQAAGKRFEEVVRRTQVYDSTLTRSEYMRSKDTGAKMATAFMAEPTTIVSMVTDALIKAERGDAKFLRNTAAAVAMSVIVNALAASLVYAMRDDDKDETYKEKYIASVAMETADAFNPLGYLPIARDIVSIMQGYEVERSDMTLVSNLVDQVEMITSSKRSVADKVAGVSGAVSAFFGIPVTNVYRDAKGALNTILGQVDTEKTTNAGISAAIKKEFTTIFGLFDEKTKNSYQLYQATIKGDETHLNRVRARYESPQAAELALRQALRDNDPRIAEAAQARISGELDVYESIVEQIEGEGVFDRNIVIRAVNNEINAINNDAKATTVPKAEDEEEDTPEQLYKSSDLNAALERGDEDDFLDVYASLLSYKMDAGKTEAQAKSAVKSSITTYWKKRYLAAWEANDTQEIKRIQAVLLSTGLYGSQNEVAETGRNWIRAYAESTSK